MGELASEVRRTRPTTRRADTDRQQTDEQTAGGRRAQGETRRACSEDGEGQRRARGCGAGPPSAHAARAVGGSWGREGTGTAQAGGPWASPASRACPPLTPARIHRRACLLRAGLHPPVTAATPRRLRPSPAHPGCRAPLIGPLPPCPARPWRPQNSSNVAAPVRPAIASPPRITPSIAVLASPASASSVSARISPPPAPPSIACSCTSRSCRPPALRTACQVAK